MTNVWKKLSAAALLAMSAAPSADACTSWIIHKSVSASGRMLVQKCRDSRVTILDADVRRSRHGVKWMRIGMFKTIPLFAVNGRGVVAIMNDGDDLTVKHPNNARPELKDAHMWIACAEIMRQIMDECDNAEQAVKLIVHYGRNRIQCGRGQTMFVADPRRAFMIDLGPGYAEAKEVTGGIIIITNCLHLPGIESISCKPVTGVRSDRAREANTRAELQKRRVNGKYTVKGTFEVSRLLCQKDMKGKYPCRRNSLGGTCFEIDSEFPAELTTAYLALGPQQHTVYVPTPMAIEQFPVEIRNGEWADMAYKLREQVGYDHRYIADFDAFEARVLVEYDDVREKARELLKAGKKAEAVKLLNECYVRHYAEALELLRKCAADAAANPPQGEKIQADL
ncbi:MAG: hypothetical protein J6Y54_04290 [Lentisphaeria bacterium]|nr:hypothetical protein [Lentisphaeria bacterium]